MTIQRQYSLPNCTLILEGIGDDVMDGNLRPLLSVLVNAECRFMGQDQTISGGIDFFEQLIHTTSRYTQQLLSGVHLPIGKSPQATLVELVPSEHQRHQLTVKSAAGSNGQATSLQTAVELKLSTVQLFDLMEAIDQALADTQTLPQLQFQVLPLPKRQVGSSEMPAKRALPAALGVSGLAIAAAALFFLPIPEVERREDDPTRSLESDPAQVEDNASIPPPPTDSTAPTDTDPAATPTAPEPTQAEVEAVLDAAIPLSDPDEIVALNQLLRLQIDETWDRDAIDFDEPLIYRVGANPDGQIVGYRFVNDPALDFVDSTPLPALRSVPNPAATRVPVGQYRVVLNPDGVVEVSPWFALPDQPEESAATTENPNSEASPATPAPTTNPTTTPEPATSSSSTSSSSATTANWENSPEIDDIVTVERLTLNLYDAVQEVWEERDYPEDLIYRVTLNQDGEVLAIAPENGAARLTPGDPPLAQLPTANTATEQLDFQVVLTEAGFPEVSPWDGYPE